ncbi:MAG: RQC domain-containing protein [Clostridiales bacterium]
MRVVCIDFETANSYTGSICSLGLTVIEDKKVVLSDSCLVKPHREYNYFNSLNVNIHGIKKVDVEDVDEFDKVYYDKLYHYTENSVFVAHNASFDMSALRNVLDLYNIEYPKFSYICTMFLSRKLWPNLKNHKLNTVSTYLNHNFKHHDALDDAIACANIIVEAFKKTKTSNIIELSKNLNLNVLKLTSKSNHMYNINSFNKTYKNKSSDVKIKLEDATIEAQKIFSCIKRMKEGFNIKLISKVLKGELNDEITDKNFHKLTTYGIMKEYEFENIMKLINEFINQEYLYEITSERNNKVVKLKEKSKYVLWKNAKVKIDNSKNLLLKK